VGLSRLEASSWNHRGTVGLRSLAQAEVVFHSVAGVYSLLGLQAVSLLAPTLVRGLASSTRGIEPL